MNEQRRWKVGLLVLLVFQVIVASSLAAFAYVDFPSLLGQFGIKHQADMGILRMIMIYNLLLSASLCGLCASWIRRNNLAGVQGGTVIGFLIFMVSFLVFVQFDRLDMLLFDSLRAFVMVVFGVLAYREHQKHNAIA